MDENNKMTGMLTDRDISMAAYTRGAKLVDITVGTAMARVIFTCKASDNNQLAHGTMRQANSALARS